MIAVPNKHAGFAAITLIESLLVHLQEMGILSEEDRDLVYQIAIQSHLEAEHHDNDPSHLSVAALLRVLHKRADGVKIVGDMPDEPQET